MNLIIAFLKRNLFELICGGVALVGLVMCLLAYSQYDSIQERMEDATALSREIEKYRRNPVNPALIEAERQANSEIMQQYEDVVTLASAKNARQPLLDNVFPVIASDNVPFEFVQAYESAFGPMLRELHARGEPTQGDYDYYQRVIDRELQELGIGKEQAVAFLEQCSPQERMRYTKETRASIEIAHQVHCYASLDSFDRAVFAEGLAPDEAFMWQAQLGLWIQRDVVAAIKRLNDAAAEQYLSQTGQPGWVAHLPVKQLVAILVAGYQTEISGDRQEGMGGGSGVAVSSFTERKSGSLYDVVQFSVHVVVDGRALPQLIDEIYKTNFYVLIDADMARRPVDTSQVGMIFGGAPVVEATLAFEGYLLRENYKAMMPKRVRDALGVPGGG